MKRNVICFTLAAFLLGACKKDNTTNDKPTGKTHKVTFSITNFKQQTVNNQSKVKVNTATTITAAIAPKLYFTVFDSQGNVVKVITQSSSATNFGEVSSNLEAGTYTVLAAAGGSGLLLSSLEGIRITPHTYQINNLQTTRITYSTWGIPALGQELDDALQVKNWSDTFYEKFSLTVGNTDITQNVTLERIVGKLVINVVDAIPTNAKRMFIRVTDEDVVNYASTLDNDYNRFFNLDIALPDSVKGKSGANFDIIMANTTRPFSVTFTFFDTADKALANSVTVNNVSLQKNTATILRGKVFDLSAAQVQVSLQTWDPVPHGTIHF